MQYIIYIYIYTTSHNIFAESVTVKMSVGKLVIRSTTKMSLHDRFTQLDYQVSPS